MTVVGRETYRLLSNLLAPDKPAKKTYSELVKTLKDHIAPKPLIIAERFKIHQRCQGEAEGVDSIQN